MYFIHRDKHSETKSFNGHMRAKTRTPESTLLETAREQKTPTMLNWCAYLLARQHGPKSESNAQDGASENFCEGLGDDLKDIVDIDRPA